MRHLHERRLPAEGLGFPVNLEARSLPVYPRGLFEGMRPPVVAPRDNV